MVVMGLLRTSVIVLLTAVAVVKIPSWLKTPRPTVLDGHSSAGWERVGDVFKENIQSGLERGASFAVYHKGKLVAHYYGGYADADAAIPWTKETLSIIFSSSKFLGALMIGMLVERGLLDYKQPVSKYWPEFAQHGKGHVTVEQLMSHQVGLSHIDETFTLHEPVDDPEGMGRKLAAQKPHWTPGTSHGYHGLTIGLYVDQLVRRVDPKHRDVKQFFEEEVAKPFGLDISLGLPAEENYRCARLVKAGLESFMAVEMWPYMWQALTQPNSLSAKMGANPPEFTIKGIWNNPDFRRSTNPSANGFATSTSLAKLMGIVGNGGSFEGKKLISANIIKQMITPLTSGLDETLRLNTTFGPGPFLLKSPVGSTVIGHPGAGGQMAYADPECQLGWAYITNYMAPGLVASHTRYNKLEKAVYEAYGKLKTK